MIKKLNIKISILIISIIILSSYFFLSLIIGNDKFNNLKLILNDEKKQLIKKYIFPYKWISQQEETISQLNKIISQPQQEETISQLKDKISHQEKIISQHLQLGDNLDVLSLEFDKKTKGSDIKTNEVTIKLLNNITLKKYLLTSGFYAGINNRYPGSGYIDFHGDNIFILSSRGILAFNKNLQDGENFKQIENNIDKFIGLKQLKHYEIKTPNLLWFSLKDLLIFNDKIFISYTEEIKKSCWNTGVIYADINYEKIEFKKLFSPKECVEFDAENRTKFDTEFVGTQSGGRIISFDDNHILLSIGDYRRRYLAQDKQSINGKIIKINIDNSNYEIISMGHRNPQGLYFDKEKNFILETEHGPKGGDEINLIEVSKISKDKIQNYGWPISSAGKHYVENKKLYEKYPLYNSHSEHGFIEPLKSFVPSIAISEIVKIGQNKYVFGSMKDKSIYFFELNKQKQIINLGKVEVNERVRDLRFNNNQLYLFMESTASIGVINTQL